MRILLVSHESSRTGAPRVAVMVARTLAGAGHEVRVVARAPGPLLDELGGAAPTRVEPFGRVRRRLWTWSPSRGLALLLDTLVAATTLLRLRPDLIYLNSTSSAAYLRPARWLGLPVLMHAHESAAVASTFLAANRAWTGLSRVRLVACSPSVQRELADLTSRPVDSVAMLPSVPDGDLVDHRAGENVDLAWPDDRLVVGSCGTVESRKGADLWVRVAHQVLREAPELDVEFAWIGDVAEPVGTGGESRVTFCGPRENPYPYLRRFDLLALTSRDDPFPLVVLESMHLGTPVVAFGVGAVPLQIGAAGVIVAPGDVDDFARQVVSLLRDASRRRSLGAAARALVVERYSASAFVGALTRLIDESSGTA